MKRVFLPLCIVMWVVLLGLLAAPQAWAQATPATQAATQPARTIADALLMAGDEQSLWLVEPQVAEGKRLSRLMEHPSNRQVGENEPRMFWRQVGERFREWPVALASWPVRENRSSSMLVFADGTLVSYRYSEPSAVRDTPPRLPEGQRPVTAIRVANGLVVLTRGPASLPTTRPAATRPAASAPATPAGDPHWNLLTYNNAQWQLLASLRPEKDLAPPLTAQPVLTHDGTRLWLLWPGAGSQEIVGRSVPLRDPHAGWGERVTVRLKAEAGKASHLMATSLEGRPIVAWSVARSPEERVLVGARLATDGTLAIDREWPMLNLATLFPKFDSAAGLALGVTGSSLALATKDADKKVQVALLDSQGATLGAATPATPLPVRRPVLNPQYIVMMVLMVLLGLSLWQRKGSLRRQSLPKGMEIARLRRRLVAGVIDLAVPFLTVYLYATQVRQQDFAAAPPTVTDNYAQWDYLLQNTHVLAAFLGYLTHVTLGELLTGRSLGKAICGLKVVAMDGSRARPLAVLVRNAVRIPEMSMAFILLIFLLVTEQRQRLGDLLARTLVVHEKGDEGE